MRAWTVLVLLIGACGWTSDPGARRGPPPGLLWITLEGVAPGDEGLDPLRACGTEYTRTYLPTPQLQPNLATLFTGRSPTTHGMWTEGHHRLGDGHATVATRAQAAGWRTTSSSGTVRTRRATGLHQGFATAHDQPDAVQHRHAAEAVVQRITWAPEGELVWVHLRAADLSLLPTLLAAFELAHPEGTTVAVGVEGTGAGLELTDDDLHVPLLVCGSEHPAQVRDDRVLGLARVTGEVRLKLGLPLEGTLPLRVDGPGQVPHEARAGQGAFGAAVSRGITLESGRLVRDGSADTWFPVSEGRIIGYGQPASAGSQAHRRLEQVAPPVGASPRRFPSPAEVLALAGESPWALVDPDQPAGKTPLQRLPRAEASLREGVRALGRRQLGPTVAAGAELPGTPAAHWLQLLAHRQAGRTDEGLEAVSNLGLGDQATWASAAAWLALEGFHRAEAVDRAHQLRAAHPEHPGVHEQAATIVTLAALHPWAVAEDHARAQATADEWVGALPDSPRRRALSVLRHPDPPTHEGLPSDPTGRLAWARQQWSAGNVVAATDALRSLLRREPTHAVARVELALWDRELGLDEEAVRLLAALARQHPEDPLLQTWFAEARAGHTPEERQERQRDRAFNKP